MFKKIKDFYQVYRFNKWCRTRFIEPKPYFKSYF